jgi:hypothetical protein
LSTAPQREPLPTPPAATFALVLGIAGLIALPVICSVAAIALGRSALTRIDANPRYQGRGIAQAGFLLGIAGLVLWGVFFVVALVEWIT